MDFPLVTATFDIIYSVWYDKVCQHEFYICIISLQKGINICSSSLVDTAFPFLGGYRVPYIYFSSMFSFLIRGDPIVQGF